MSIYDDGVHADSPGFVPYEKPVAGPRAFVARGPSGWAETFPRPAADRALLSVLAPAGVTLERAIYEYASTCKAARGSADPWQFASVAAVLLRVTGNGLTGKPGDLPSAAVVAFWALSDVAMKANPALGKVDSKDYPLEGTGRVTN